MKPLLVILLVLMQPVFAYAASDTATQTITVTVLPSASLRLDSSTVAFPTDNPIAVKKLAQVGTVDIQAEAVTSDRGSVTLTAQAKSDLLSHTDRIPIDAISWVGSGLGYASTGVLNDRQAQTLGRWDHSGIFDGTITYLLTNEWDYAAGTYTTTVTYTLTAL